MRGLAAEDIRWQTRLRGIFSRLRCMLGQWRIKAAHHNRPVRDTLPIAAPSVDLSTLEYGPLLQRTQEKRVALSFVKLFPNDDHYLVCEVAPTAGLSVGYRFYLMKCMPMPAKGICVRSDQWWLTYDPNNASDSTVAGGQIPSGVAMRITHFISLDGVSKPTPDSDFVSRSQQQQPPVSRLCLHYPRMSIGHLHSYTRACCSCYT